MSEATHAPTPHTALADAALDQLFLEARTIWEFEDRPVPEATLRRLYDVLKFGPTSANCSPARFIFVASPEGKQRLGPLMSEGNREKTMKAPVTAIVAIKEDFPEDLPRLFPHDPTAPSWFKDEGMRKSTAFRNSSLQGAYLILAARALGLSCGPMSGFDAAGVEREFLGAQGWKANFLCNLGYRAGPPPFPRQPRLPFEEACQLV